MDSLIMVGGKLEKESAVNLAAFVKEVFESGKAQGMEQSTIVHALSLVQKVTQPENVNITSCNLKNIETSKR